MTPTVGRIVIIKLADWHKKQLVDAAFARGEQHHNPNNGADEAPAVIVRVWSDTCANLKVLLDGKDDMWITSAIEGDQPGQWHWPVIQKS